MRRVATLFLLVPCLVASASLARAQDTLECLVPGIQDFRAGPAHLEQADIVSGKIPLAEVLATGLTLMITNFNRCDGQGRPGATGRDIPQERPLPPALIQFFTRTSGLEAMSCASCHNQPQSLGAGDHAANVLQQPAPARSQPSAHGSRRPLRPTSPSVTPIPSLGLARWNSSDAK
jgi:hypothetical protein